MHGVMKNIAQLCAKSNSSVWDAEGWKKVVVCIVADGRKKCDARVLDVLTTMGVFQKGIAKNMVHDKPVQAHLFEVKIKSIFNSAVSFLSPLLNSDTSFSTLPKYPSMPISKSEALIEGLCLSKSYSA